MTIDTGKLFDNLNQLTQKTMENVIVGTREKGSPTVRVDGTALSPGPSQKLINHSPCGFAWGYAGSGPAQLALAILLHVLNDEEKAMRWYQDFKREFIATQPMNNDFTLRLDVAHWVSVWSALTKD